MHVCTANAIVRRHCESVGQHRRMGPTRACTVQTDRDASNVQVFESNCDGQQMVRSPQAKAKLMLCVKLLEAGELDLFCSGSARFSSVLSIDHGNRGETRGRFRFRYPPLFAQ